MKWLVLGLGNPLAGADGFGPAVIARLRRESPPDGAHFVDAHTDLLAHLHRFEHFDRVVLVDTVLDGRGGVAVIDEAEFSHWDDRSGGVHQLSPLAAVKLFRRLYPATAARITLVAHFVPEHAFGLRPGTATVQAAADLVRRVCSAPTPVTLPPS
jgi:hydrogenase maturation protease